MSDKHDSKRKDMRAKAHVGGAGKPAQHQPANDPGIDAEIKQAAGTTQETLASTRKSANKAHQSQGRKG